MRYAAVEASRQLAAPWVSVADALRSWTAKGPLNVAPARVVATALGTWADAVRRWPKPEFGVGPVIAAGESTPRAVQDCLAVETPFCGLRRFELLPPVESMVQRNMAMDTRPTPARRQILLVAPLSGNFATLLRDTVSGLLTEGDVWLTDWRCASEVPLGEGDLGLDDFVALLQRFLRHIADIAPSEAGCHLVAVCQPGVAALAAAALLKEAGDDAAPASIALLGCPIDPRVNPKVPNRLAFDRPLAWFEHNLLQTVPAGFAGVGRRVYPGHLQHLAFLCLKPHYHVEKHTGALLAAWRGDHEGVATHDAFYREFRATLDLPATFYLDTIDRVFQRAELARGAMVVAGQAVDLAVLASTPLLAVEGELDDITGPGQTAAALSLCGAATAARRHHLQPGVGHLGLFSGSRFLAEVMPVLAAHHEAA